MKTILSVVLLLTMGGCKYIYVTPAQLDHMQNKVRVLCPEGLDRITLKDTIMDNKAEYFSVGCTNGLQSKYLEAKEGGK